MNSLRVVCLPEASEDAHGPGALDFPLPFLPFFGLAGWGILSAVTSTLRKLTSSPFMSLLIHVRVVRVESIRLRRETWC